MILGLGTDPAFPIRVGVQLGVTRAAREEQRKEERNNSRFLHFHRRSITAPKAICESISAKEPQTRLPLLQRGVRNKFPNRRLADEERNKQ